MRYLFVLLAILSFGVANANPVRVSGYGASYEEAKNDAFRKAIEYKVGSMILSEKERRNYELVKDDIIIYSSGYVTNFKVIERRNGPEVSLLMDVWVEEKNITQRLTPISNEVRDFKGEIHKEQIESIKDRRDRAARLLDAVLNDYPYRAFVLTQYPYHVDISNVDNPVLVLNFNFKWNKEYLMSLKETLEIIQENSGDNTISIYGLTRFSFGSLYRTERYIVTKFYNDFGGHNHVKIKVTILDMHENVIEERCFMPYKMYNYYNFTMRGLVIEPMGNNMRQSFSMPITNIEKIDKINLSVVASRNCKNQ